MMKRAWKCNNCAITRGVKGGYNFTAEGPQCPQCGADGTKNKHIVVACVVMHLDPPTAVYNKGLNVLACQPGVSILGSGKRYHATGDFREVTCEACKRSSYYEEAKNRAVDMSNAIVE